MSKMEVIFNIFKKNAFLLLQPSLSLKSFSMLAAGLNHCALCTHNKPSMNVFFKFHCKRSSFSNIL